MGKVLRRKRVIPYSQDAMNKALKDVKSGAPLNTVCKKYKIPRSTLHYKFIREHVKDKPGRDPVLDASEEDKLVVWINFMYTLGRPLSISQITNSVALLVKKLEKPTPFSDGRPGRHWCDGFFRRHKGTKHKIRESEKFGRVPPNAHSIKKWFSDIGECLQEEDLTNVDPSRVFNIGEVNWPLYANDLNESDSDSSNEIVDLEKFRILMAGNAAGKLAPKMVIFYNEEDKRRQCNNFPEEEWKVSWTHNGKMSVELFYEYIVSHFYPWLIKSAIEPPVILYLDGYVNYLSQLLCEFCSKHKIALVVLPPGTTHLLQPIHVGLALKLKSRWGKAIKAYMIDKKVSIVNKTDIAELLIKLFSSIKIDETLISGFQTCGLYPFRIEGIDFAKSQKKRSKRNNKQKEPNTASNCQSSLIEAIERYIEPSVLDTFKSALCNSEWTGNVEDKSLFNVWKRIVNNDCEIIVEKRIFVDTININSENEISESIPKLYSLPSECTVLEINNGFIENEDALKPMHTNLDKVVYIYK